MGSGSLKRGVLVVFVGPDGSGKTTVADALAELLRADGRDTCRLYMGVGTPALPTRRLKQALRRRRGAGTPGGDPPRLDAGRPHRRRELAHVWLDFVWRYAAEIRGRLRGGQVVICDRYAYDWATWETPGLSTHRLLTVLRRLVPRPDVTIFLSAPPEVIVARKDELTPQEVHRQQERLRALVAGLPGAATVDATAPVEQVARQAAGLVARVGA